MLTLSNTEQPCNQHLAALVAINIVTEVLDEAENILNAANDLGKPWRFIWRQKKTKGEFYENAEILGILNSNFDDDDVNNCEIIQSDSVIITSTPQKETDESTKTYNELSFIGQGDEDIKSKNQDLRSPSMLINNLFDMSELDKEVHVDLDLQEFQKHNAAILVESCVNLALNIVCGDIVNLNQLYQHSIVSTIEVSSNSSYSMLTDAIANDDTENENATYFIDYVKPEDKDQCITKISDKMSNVYDLKEATNRDIDLYEKTYLTLNRDYEKYSEEEDFVADEISYAMQEVELTTNKFPENVAIHSEPTQTDINKIGSASSTSAEDKKKNSLVKRCRLQGAKFMTRLRSWWWKPRLIGKRKGCRSGICPLSPEARNRGGSLLDHRKLRSPSPARMVTWKFNTINEALIHSYNMKDFDFSVQDEKD